MERVSIIKGKLPIILVCPHGPDDTLTDVVTELAANLGHFYAVINNGFERDNIVDVDNNIADCNRVDHVTQDVVREEFLNPIIKYKDDILYGSNRGNSTNGFPMGSMYDQVFVFYIHGFGDQVEKDAKQSIDLIMGYGESDKKTSYTCELHHRDYLINSWQYGNICIGKGGGKYAARDSNNMTQYFRKHIIDHDVMSMQIEVSRRIRKNQTEAETTALNLATALTDFYHCASGAMPCSPVDASKLVFI